MQMQIHCIDNDNRGGDKLDINFVDGEYSIYHSQFKRKAHQTNIRPNNINNKYNTSSGRGRERRRMNYMLWPSNAEREPWKMFETIIGFSYY